MSERLLSLCSWLGARKLLAGWVAALAGLVLCGGSIALGASWAEDAAFAVPPAEAAGVARDAPPPGTLEAVVIARRPAGYLARTRAGDLVLIRVDARTRFRALGKAADATAVRRNTVVVVRGVPGARAGMIRARLVVARRGVAAPPTPAVE